MATQRPGCNYTPFYANPQFTESYAYQIARSVRESPDNRKAARFYFDADLAASQFVDLIEDIDYGSG
jgi:hypothetical protein